MDAGAWTVAMRVAALLLASTLPGCLTGGVPITPYPDVAYVPHPLSLGDDYTLEELEELYRASPNRNPDGLGVLDTLWLNSRTTLVTWHLARRVEERNRLAYARTEAEQALALAEARARYREHWVFEGMFLGQHERLIGADFYRPEGIYAVDDRGRKFLPVAAGDADPILYPRIVGQEGVVYYSYPRIVFPADLITRETRAVSLYVAAFFKRARFTWVFDPDYEVPGRGPGPDSGRGRNRLFPQG